MEFKIGLAKTAKYGNAYSGDGFSTLSLPAGGIAAVLADGQGSGSAAYEASGFCVDKAMELLRKGTHLDLLAKQVHAAFYDLDMRTASCAFILTGVDWEAQTLVISRNTGAPVIVMTPEYETVYDDMVESLGVHRHTKPHVYELPLEEGMRVVLYTDGVAHAGKKRFSHDADREKYLKLIRDAAPEDVDFLAESLLESAISLDRGEPADDMTVAVLSCLGQGDREVSGLPPIETHSASFII